MKKDTSDPAFPGNSEQYGPFCGMSLRDYFAAKVLQGLMADPNTTADIDRIVSVSWGIADKMIAARSK